MSTMFAQLANAQSMVLASGTFLSKADASAFADDVMRKAPGTTSSTRKLDDGTFGVIIYAAPQAN